MLHGIIRTNCMPSSGSWPHGSRSVESRSMVMRVKFSAVLMKLIGSGVIFRTFSKAMPRAGAHECDECVDPPTLEDVRWALEKTPLRKAVPKTSCPRCSLACSGQPRCTIRAQDSAGDLAHRKSASALEGWMAYAYAQT